MHNTRLSIGGVFLMMFLSVLTISPVKSISDDWTITRLTNNSVYDVDVCISGDGSKIAFVEDRDGDIYTSWDWDVMLIDLNTMDMQRITEREPDAFGLPDLWPSLNYDGSKFIYDEYIIFDFYVISSNIDGTNNMEIADYAKYPYLTSDGTKILYTIENEDEETGETYYQLHIASIDGSNDRILFTGSDRDYIAKANSDGSKIVFCREGYYRDELYIIDSDGTNLRKISDVPSFSTFGISDDGTKIVYTKLMDDGTYRAAMYDTTTGTETLLGPAGSSAPFISGDGSQIVYLYTQNDKIYLKIVDGPDIYIGDAEYTANYYDRLYTPTRYASISRDGSKIAFVSCADGNPEIYIAAMENIYIPSGSILNSFFVPDITFSYTTIIFESEKSPLSTVTIPVTIEEVDGAIGSINLDLTYNSEILTAVDVIPGDLTQNSIIEKNIGEGRIRIGLIDTNGINEDGTLFYVKFNVTTTNKTSSKTEYTGELGGRIDISSTLPGFISRGDYSPLNIENAVVSDLEGNKITVMTINGTFTVGSKKGDVNGDGVITSVDALMALKMSVGELEVNMVADMDEDGQVLANDALQIMNLALNYDVQHFAGLLSTGFNFNSFGGG